MGAALSYPIPLLGIVILFIKPRASLARPALPSWAEESPAPSLFRSKA